MTTIRDRTAVSNPLVEVRQDFQLGAITFIYACFSFVPLFVISLWLFHWRVAQIPWYAWAICTSVLIWRVGVSANHIASSRVTSFILGLEENPENPAVKAAISHARRQQLSEIIQRHHQTQRRLELEAADLKKLIGKISRG
jgi:hypothetical protein